MPQYIFHSQTIFMLGMLLASTCVLASDETPEVFSNQCDLYTQIPIGIHVDETKVLLNEPSEIDDIPLFVYTWNVEDGFLILRYDRKRLITVEVSKTCDNFTHKDTKLCEYFEQYKTHWPSYKTVEKKLGKPIETKKIPRKEWIWKNTTEVVYIEVQENLVKKIDCVPNKIRYIDE